MPVGCLYIADFPVWVRQQLGPVQDLVAVHRHQRIVSLSPALRGAGLREGDLVGRLRSIVPFAVCHEQDPPLEEAMWEDQMMMLYGVTPNILPVRPGLALLAPWDLERFRRHLGGVRTGRGGIGDGRLGAIVAALQAEEGTLADFLSSDGRSPLGAASTEHLVALGFARELVERLGLFGLHTIGGLMRLSRRQLNAQFGEEGKRLHLLVHEEESGPIPLFQPAPTHTVRYEFDPPAIEPGDLFPILKMLVHNGVEELEGLLAQRLTIRLDGRGMDPIRVSRRILKAPTRQPYRLYVHAELIARAMLRRESPIDRVELEFGSLVAPEAVQTNLFYNRHELYEAVRQLHRRYPGVVVRAVVTDPLAYHPEDGYRLEPYPDTLPPRKKQRGRR